MKRDTSNDIMKAVCIAGMVWCHAALPHFVAVPKWFCLFIMGVFFMSSGWFYHCGDEEPTSGDVGAFVWRRIKRIWIPWVVWGGMFLLLHDVFLKLNVYPCSREIGGWCWKEAQFCTWGWREIFRRFPQLMRLTQGGGIMASGFWFLRSLFFASIAYCVTDTTVRKVFKCKIQSRTIMSLIAISSLLVGRYLYTGPLLRLGRIGGAPTLTAFGLIHLGVMLRWFECGCNGRKKRAVWIRILTPLGCAVFLGWQSLGPNFIPVLNRYSSIIRLLTCSLAGWFMLKFLADEISERRVGRALGYVGRHTMPILIFHLLAFKIVSVIGVWVNGMEWIWVGRFTTTFDGIWWSLAYTLVGIAVPLAASEVFHRIVRRLRMV